MNSNFSRRKLIAKWLSVLALSVTSSVALADTVLVFDDTALGLNDEGHLNVFEPGPDPGGDPIGLWRIGLGDATSPGCLCEGWGVSVNGTTSGFVNESAGSGGLAPGTFTIGPVNPITGFPSAATSNTGLLGIDVGIQHAYGPSLYSGVFQAVVTIDNRTGGTVNDVRYRRVMDWDVPPTEFDEYVTHGGVVDNLVGNGGNVLFASDDGFLSSDPLSGTGFINPETVNTDFIDNGPDDHGSIFDFAFGSLDAGERRQFNIFYGSTANEEDALEAIDVLGIDVYSLGQSNPDSGGFDPDDDFPTDPEDCDGDFDCLCEIFGECDGLPLVAGVSGPGNPDGTPATFLFGFSGVGGVDTGTTEDDPVTPLVEEGDDGTITFGFPSPTPRRWFDPPFTDTFVYEAIGGEFLEVGVPSGFGTIDVVVGGVVVDSLSTGETYLFGAGVSTFSLTGIDPLLDMADPGFATAFATFLDFTGSTTDVTMTAIPLAAVAVPEPAGWSIFLITGLGIMLLRIRRKSKK